MLKTEVGVLFGKLLISGQYGVFLDFQRYMELDSFLVLALGNKGPIKSPLPLIHMYVHIYVSTYDCMYQFRYVYT